MRLEVRRFEPKEGDILHRKYMDGGLPKAQDLPPFCLADVKQTAKTFREYIECNARSGLQAAADSDGIVKDAFAMLATHYDSLDVRALVTEHWILLMLYMTRRINILDSEISCRRLFSCGLPCVRFLDA
jgi:hypothetical protein